MTKTNRPIKGDGEWRKHRNKYQKRYYWKRERQAYKRSAKEQIEIRSPQPTQPEN